MHQAVVLICPTSLAAFPGMTAKIPGYGCSVTWAGSHSCNSCSKLDHRTPLLWEHILIGLRMRSPFSPLKSGFLFHSNAILLILLAQGARVGHVRNTEQSINCSFASSDTTGTHQTFIQEEDLCGHESLEFKSAWDSMGTINQAAQVLLFEKDFVQVQYSGSGFSPMFHQ